jgi:transcriptional regulator with XRE-family HTH domain
VGVDPTTGASRAPMAGLGAIIARARTRAGLLQAELAEVLSVQQSSVRQWERDESTPTLVLFRRIAAVLGPWPLLAAVLPPPDPGADGSVDAAGDARQAWWPAPQEVARLLGQLHPEQAIGEPAAAGAASFALLDGELGKHRPSVAPPRNASLRGRSEPYAFRMIIAEHTLRENHPSTT